MIRVTTYRPTLLLNVIRRNDITIVIIIMITQELLSIQILILLYRSNLILIRLRAIPKSRVMLLGTESLFGKYCHSRNVRELAVEVFKWESLNALKLLGKMRKKYLQFIVTAFPLSLVVVVAAECRVLQGGGLQLGDLAQFVVLHIVLEL